MLIHTWSWDRTSWECSSSWPIPGEFLEAQQGMQPRTRRHRRPKHPRFISTARRSACPIPLGNGNGWRVKLASSLCPGHFLVWLSLKHAGRRAMQLMPCFKQTRPCLYPTKSRKNWDPVGHISEADFDPSTHTQLRGFKLYPGAIKHKAQRNWIIWIWKKMFQSEIVKIVHFGTT